MKKIPDRMGSLLTILFIIFSVLALIACSPQQNKVDSYIGLSIPQETLDEYIQVRMDELNIPGLSLAIVNDGEVVYKNSYGYANIDEGIPVTDQTIFEGGSISKPVFAFFVMTFVEEGKLDLDKPLHEYYPHPDLVHDDAYRKITARMVLSHQSGLPNWREDEEDETLKLKFEPGTGYLYSGEGYQYLAMVLKEIEQTDWIGLDNLFQEKIATPLGLENTVYIQTPYTRLNRAEPYNEAGELIDWENDYWYLKNDGNFIAPASIYSEPKDFSTWMLAVINEELLTSESYEELLKPHTSVSSDIIEIDYTLGFLTPHISDTDIYLHSGNNVGFTSWFALDANKDWGFVIFTNSDNGEAFGEELFFYLFTGTNSNQQLIILGLFVVTLLFLLFFGIKSIRNYIRHT